MSGIANFFFPKKQDEYCYTQFQDRVYRSATGETHIFREERQLEKNGNPVPVEEIDRSAYGPHDVGVFREECQISGGKPETPDYFEKVLMRDRFTVQSTDWKASVLRVGTAACAILMTSLPFIIA